MTRDEMATVLEGVLGLMTTQAERSPAALAGVMAVLAALQAEAPPVCGPDADGEHIIPPGGVCCQCGYYSCEPISTPEAEAPPPAPARGDNCMRVLRGGSAHADHALCCLCGEPTGARRRDQASEPDGSRDRAAWLDELSDTFRANATRPTTPQEPTSC
jgi:Na+-translocating ferredoxin:NAD+ oxidoreductase RNF subunit RnfB